MLISRLFMLLPNLYLALNYFFAISNFVWWSRNCIINALVFFCCSYLLPFIEKGSHIVVKSYFFTCCLIERRKTITTIAIENITIQWQWWWPTTSCTKPYFLHHFDNQFLFILLFSLFCFRLVAQCMLVYKTFIYHCFHSSPWRMTTTLALTQDIPYLCSNSVLQAWQ